MNKLDAARDPLREQLPYGGAYPSGQPLYAGSSGGADADMGLGDIFRAALSAVRRHRLLFWGTLLALVTLGVTYVSMKEPLYDARASIKIDPRQTGGLDQPSGPSLLFTDKLIVDSEVEVLQSEGLAMRVIERLDLLTPDPDAEAPSPSLVQRIKSLLPVGEEAPPPTEAEAALDRRRSVLSRVRENLTVEREGETYVIHITYRSPDPERSADIANAVAETYLLSEYDAQLENNRRLNTWLAEQITELNAEVIEAERAVEKFVFENGLSDNARHNTLQQELTEANSALIDARRAARVSQTSLAQVDQILSDLEEGKPIGSVSMGTRRDAGLNQAETEYAQLFAQVKYLTEKVGRNNRQTRLAQQELDLAAIRVAEEFRSLRFSHLANIDAARREETALLARIDALEIEVASVAQKDIQRRDLQRAADALRSQYEGFLRRFEESEREGLFTSAAAEVITRALPPANPSAPRTAMIVVLSLFGGLVMGSALVFLREQLDDTVRTADDISNQVGLDCLGLIPTVPKSRLRDLPGEIREAAKERRIRRRQRRDLSRLTYAARFPYSRFAETLRRIMFDLSLDGKDATCRVIGVASVLAGEGKTTLSANFAFFLAQRGFRVALIDGDFRKPALSEQLGPICDGISIGEALAQPYGAAAAAPEPFPGLLFFGTRSLDEAKSMVDAVSSPAMETLLDALREDCDVVVIDTPPLAYVVDGLAASALADHFVLTVRWGSTSIGTIRRTLMASRTVTSKLIGAVIGGVSVTSVAKYGEAPLDPTYFQDGKGG
ncbi:MAG: polysaccharide biosynthesis tyrosine autokinase [Pseudomonadota bacterium]